MAGAIAPGGLCGLLQDGIEQYDQIIDSLGRRIASLKALLEQLEGRPDPDPAKIEALERQLAGLEQELAEALDAKRALEDEYSFVGCGSHG